MTVLLARQGDDMAKYVYCATVNWAGVALLRSLWSTTMEAFAQQLGDKYTYAIIIITYY